MAKRDKKEIGRERKVRINDSSLSRVLMAIDSMMKDISWSGERIRVGPIAWDGKVENLCGKMRSKISTYYPGFRVVGVSEGYINEVPGYYFVFSGRQTKLENRLTQLAVA